jgi:hypothetical protein
MVSRGRNPRAAPPGGAPAGVAAASSRTGVAPAAPFLLLALLAALYCGTGMVQAVDTWWGLAAGRQIAAHGVSDADPFTFSARPAAAALLPAGASAWQRLVAWALPTGWINQNWLTHLLMFELTRVFGTNALVGFRFAAYLAAAALVLAAARAHGASTECAAGAAAVALVACRPFAEFRAQEVSLVLTAALLLLLAVTVRRAPGALWAAAPLVALWSNAHGGFIYGLVALVVYALAWVVAGPASQRWAGGGPAGVRRASATAAAAAALAVIASPFHLANLTHPLAITVGPDAEVWRRVNEWRPALGGGRPGEVVVFLVMVGLTAVALAISLRAQRPAPARSRRPSVAPADAATPPDLGGVLLAAVTVALALRSRRFVPLAALALAPVLAAAATESLRRGWSRRGGAVPAPRRARAAALAATAVAVVAAVYLAVRWDRSYLEPWPLSSTATSVFERMTWGHRRSAALGEFLHRNGVGGRAFDFWEEGGNLEWVQQPDRATGALPLRLLIDGRAQEAFPATIVHDYLELAVGGPAGIDATAEGRPPSPPELAAMSAWVGARLRRDAIWVAFLPAEREGDGIARALAASPDWRVAYRDPWQSILVDVGDSRGRALDAAVASGAADFPDEATRQLTLAARHAGSPDSAARRAALAAAVRAWALRPSAAAVVAALQAGAAPALRGEALAFASGLVDEYRRDGSRWARQNGYYERATAFVTAASFLEAEARRTGDAHGAQMLADLASAVRHDRDTKLGDAVWWG